MHKLSEEQWQCLTSAFVRELVDTGRIFKPQPWTPAEAWRLLKDVPVCDAAGVIVRPSSIALALTR